MFELISEPLPSVRHLSLGAFQDSRGSFVKLFHSPALQDVVGPIDLREIFMSESAVGVVRGMHFQTPPHDHTKLVTCTQGKVVDVVLDIRKGSGTYGQAVGVTLDAAQPELLVIPSGFAHGFTALTDQAQMVYMTTAEHAPANDCGILWNSFGFDWPEGAGHGTEALSARDQKHPTLADYDSPFKVEAPL